MALLAFVVTAFELEPSMARGRERARLLRPDGLLDDPVAGSNGRDRARRRSLVCHRALARRLRRPMVDQARHLLWTWRDLGRIDERWEEVLNNPVAEAARVIGDDSDQAADLRQSSPFAGRLSEAERRKVLSEVR